MAEKSVEFQPAHAFGAVPATAAGGVELDAPLARDAAAARAKRKASVPRPLRPGATGIMIGI